MTHAVIGVANAEHFPQGGIRGEFELSGNGRYLRLTAPFSYVDGELRVDVPADFITDFNSVPRVLWGWFPPWECPEAALVHDFGYRFNPGQRTRAAWDATHRRIMEIKGERQSKRTLAYLGIRAGGWKAWNEYRERERDRA